MTYCISDIHGCFDEFMELLERIQFNPQIDSIYILGDAIDRGDKPLDTLNFIKNTTGINLIIGNHEQMMLDYFDDIDPDSWFYNGCKQTAEQLLELPELELREILSYVRERPYYTTVHVNSKRYFLSHSGLNQNLPFNEQDPDEFIWSRAEFYKAKALTGYICIFGHTPTFWLRGDTDCSVWADDQYSDKIGIDCGCVYGGALAAIRLEDGRIFYVKSNRGNNVHGFSLPETHVSRI